MNAAARIGLMVAAILGADKLRKPGDRSHRGPRHHGRRNKVSGGRGLSMPKLLRKFRRNAIERYGLAIVERKQRGGKFISAAPVSADDRRRLRNARKQERRAAR